MKNHRKSLGRRDANSFSMTAILFPCCFVRMWFRRVVFPLPRKPVRTVTGTFAIVSLRAARSSIVLETAARGGRA